MKLQPESKKELLRIACGVSLCTAVMWVVFAALHLVGWVVFDYRVLLGGITGKNSHSGQPQRSTAHQHPARQSTSGSSIFSPSWVSQTRSSKALYQPFKSCAAPFCGCRPHSSIWKKCRRRTGSQKVYVLSILQNVGYCNQFSTEI